MKTKIVIIASAVLFAACGTKNNAPQNDPIVEHIDSALNPAENFFYYANNSWFTANPIPASETSNGIFRTIQDTINNSVRTICESASADANALKGSNKQKIGDFYFSGMDTTSINNAGITPLDEELNLIGHVSDQQSFLVANAHLHTIGCNSLYDFGVGRDDKNSSKNAIFMWQGGIGLPDRDYYFNTDARTVNIRKEYLKHLEKMFVLIGDEQNVAAKKAVKIMEIETSLAKASRKMEDTRDPYKNYNKLSLTDLDQLSSFTWKAAMKEHQLNNPDSVIVGQPEFISSLNATFKKFSIEDWKDYLRWNLVNNYADYLSKPFEDQNFQFYSGVMSGAKEQKPRWKKVVEQTDNSLGELIGQVYIKEYLPAGTKEKLLEIGNNIRDVYADHIKALDWMSEATKEKALSKLNKVVMKVGYPDKWKDMSSVEIDRSSYLKNVMNVNQWSYEDMIKKYGQPVDRTEWQMYPQTYNAYYDPTNNEICVPACNIIVPGFEGRMPDDAVLYGIIGGSTFGHELTHGFDDQGSQYDEKGNLSDWWTKEDRERFNAKTKLIVEQYNNYTVLDSMHVNGSATQGENIADLGGVMLGYEAFKKTKQGKSEEKINGLTADQRFFLAYAYAWMVNRRNENLARQIMSDVHSPSEFRVNGPLSNMPEFYAAFNVKEGDKMYRAEKVRVKIW
jgi:putative endopeptidase